LLICEVMPSVWMIAVIDFAPIAPVVGSA